MIFQLFFIFLVVTYSYNVYKPLSLRKSRLYGCPYAPKCNGEYLSKGCDGSGKIQGGIATVPFLQWWPIKVYRPCPAYLAAGYVYRREGQTLDQVSSIVLR
jgi:hypothetical protein